MSNTKRRSERVACTCDRGQGKVVLVVPVSPSLVEWKPARGVRAGFQEGLGYARYTSFEAAGVDLYPVNTL